MEIYNQLFSLKGKTIVMTGASSGLGKGLALAYGDAGANMVIASRNISNLEDLAHEIKLKGVQALPVKTDVTKQSDADNLLKKAIDEFGRVDVLVNNAGMSIPGVNAELVNEKDMQTIMDTNFKGVFLNGTIFGRHMIEQGKGKIINMSSVLGQTTWAPRRAATPRLSAKRVEISANCARLGCRVKFAHGGPS